MVKLALCLLGRQRLEKVWKLDAVTHDCVGFLLPEMFPNIEAILGVVETFDCVCRAQRPTDQGLNEPKIDQGEKFLLLTRAPAFG